LDLTLKKLFTQKQRKTLLPKMRLMEYVQENLMIKEDLNHSELRNKEHIGKNLKIINKLQIEEL
jgi:hypothetical protein